MIVVDNKKLHRTERITGRPRRAIVISFMPELVYAPGSPVCDMSYLTPFYCQVPGIDPVVRKEDARLPQIHEPSTACCAAMRSARRSGGAAGVHDVSARSCSTSSRSTSRSRRRRARSCCCNNSSAAARTLLEYLATSYGKSISVADAAGMASMSESRFMRYFRAATGMTFVLSSPTSACINAARLLRETDLNIGQVADDAGSAIRATSIGSSAPSSR